MNIHHSVQFCVSQDKFLHRNKRKEHNDFVLSCVRCWQCLLFFMVRLVLRCEEYNEAAISGTQVSYDINSFKLKVIERLSSTSVVLQQERPTATVLTHYNEDLTPQSYQKADTQQAALAWTLQGDGMRTSH